jgi:hypothetical protein
MLVRVETDVPGYTIRTREGGSATLANRGVTPLDIDLPEGTHLIQLVGWRDFPVAASGQRPSDILRAARARERGLPAPPPLPQRESRREVKVSKFIVATATPAEFRTAYRQEKANTEAEQAAGWSDPMAIFMGVTAPSYGSRLPAWQIAAQEANKPFTFVPFEEDASFGSAFPLGMDIGAFGRPTAPPVTPSTDNSPVVFRWIVKDGVDKTEAKPVAVKVKAATKAVPAAISTAIETVQTEGVVEAAKQNPLVAVAAGIGGTLGVLGLLKWLRGGRS